MLSLVSHHLCPYVQRAVIALTEKGVALHPADPLTRARHRAWIEFASATLNDIWGLYTAPDATSFEKKRGELAAKFLRLEEALAPPAIGEPAEE